MTRTVRETLKTILDAFESGNVPEAIAHSMFPIPDLPSSRWSFLNRVNIFLSGTSDARGFRQWKEVRRYVKKGAKALYILVPRLIVRKVRKDNGDDEETEVIAGFMPRPVFKVEDTEGEPLAYQNIELPELPLVDRARGWGISIKAVPGNYHYLGYYSQSRMEIALASKDETVFFHELAHAAHQRIDGDFAKLPSWEKEVVAELAASALCKMVGKDSRHLGMSFQYIRHYAEQEGLSPVKACLRVINQTEAVLVLILQQPLFARESRQSSPCAFCETNAGTLALEQAAS
jgi:hypothetical protein